MLGPLTTRIRPNVRSELRAPEPTREPGDCDHLAALRIQPNGVGICETCGDALSWEEVLARGELH